MDPKLMHVQNEITTAQEIHEDAVVEILKCDKCGHVEELPEHCGKPMHKEDNQLVCWMGASCGAQPIPTHCNKEMSIVKINNKELRKIKQKMEDDKRYNIVRLTDGCNLMFSFTYEQMKLD